MRLAFIAASAVVFFACFKVARAEDVVTSEAINETQCADIAISRGDGGTYIARGCGRTLVYECDRPAGQGLTNPGTVSNVGCRKVGAGR